MKVRGTTAGTPFGAKLTALCWGALILLASVTVLALAQPVLPVPADEHVVAVLRPVGPLARLLHAEPAAVRHQQGRVEGPSTEVVDGHWTGLVESAVAGVPEGGCDRLGEKRGLS